MRRSLAVALLYAVACAAPGPVTPRARPPASAQPAPPAPPAPPASSTSAAPVAPTPTHDAWLRDDGGHRFGLNSQGVTQIGRLDRLTNVKPDVDLEALEEGMTVSRRHAEIVRRADSWILFVHPTTTNATLLNGETVSAGTSVELQHGDVIHLGGVRLMFQVERP